MPIVNIHVLLIIDTNGRSGPKSAQIDENTQSDDWTINKYDSKGERNIVTCYTPYNEGTNLKKGLNFKHSLFRRRGVIG